jgi:hypothetical protein
MSAICSDEGINPDDWVQDAAELFRSSVLRGPFDRELIKRHAGSVDPVCRPSSIEDIERSLELAGSRLS